jgi:hypothetical protein
MASNSMTANIIVSIPKDEQPGRPTPRFSEGMERIPLAASELRIGRFSDGAAQPVAMSPDQLGSFADGHVQRPDVTAARCVGGFGDGQRAAESRQPVRVRGPHRAARAPA